MKLFKKNIKMLAMVTMLAVGLTGCASSKPETPETPTPEDPPKVEDKVEEDEVKDPAKVVVWSGSIKDKDSQKLIVEDFSAKHENIELEFKEIPEGGDITAKLMTEIAGGSKIDIFDANQAEYFGMIELGLYEPLNSYIDESGFDSSVLGQGNIDISLQDGELYALPYVQSKFVLYYNKDLFDAAGMEYPTNDWTWEEFREASLKLTSGEGADKIWGSTMPWYTATWTGIASQTGVKMIENDKPNFDNPAFKDALQFKYDLTMVDKSSPSLAENKTTKAHFTNEFSSGKTAMLVGPDWAMGSIGTNLDHNYTFEYDLAYIPHPEGVEPGTTYGAPRYVGLNAQASAEEKEASWIVLRYLAESEEVAQALSRNGATPALLTDAVAEYHLENIPPFVENAKIIFEDNPRVEEKASHTQSNIIEQIAKEEGELALSGAKTPQESVDAIQKRLLKEIVVK